MNPNDDIVGQEITNIVITTPQVIEIRLTNGMTITCSGQFIIHDAGKKSVIKKWITIENGKRVRITNVVTTNSYPCGVQEALNNTLIIISALERLADAIGGTDAEKQIPDTE